MGYEGELQTGMMRHHCLALDNVEVRAGLHHNHDHNACPSPDPGQAEGTKHHSNVGECYCSGQHWVLTHLAYVPTLTRPYHTEEDISKQIVSDLTAAGVPEPAEV